MITVAVVDASEAVRAGIGRLLDVAPDVAVLATMPIDTATADVLALNPVDVILMDLTDDAIRAIRRIVAKDPGTRIVMLAAHANAEQVLAAIDAGAIGFLLKDSAPVLVQGAIRAAARGDCPIDPRVARVLVNDRHERATHVHLNERGIEILQLAADGLLNKQIARALGIKEKTVKTHLTRVYERLGVTGRAAAVELARALDIIH